MFADIFYEIIFDILFFDDMPISTSSCHVVSTAIGKGSLVTFAQLANTWPHSGQITIPEKEVYLVLSGSTRMLLKGS